MEWQAKRWVNEGGHFCMGSWGVEDLEVGIGWGLSPGHSPCIYASSLEAHTAQAFWVPYSLAVESRQPSGSGARPSPGRGTSSLLAHCLFSKLTPNPLNLFTSHLPACLVASISTFPARSDLHVGNFSQSGSSWPLADLAASPWAARMLVSS